MNQYILYCQENRQSIATLKASCRDVFEVVAESESAELAYKTIAQLMGTRCTFALIDPNGAVILADLAIKRCTLEKKDGIVTIETFQLRKVLSEEF